MSLRQPLLRASVCASLSLPALLLAGCSDDGTVGATPTAAMAKGNWQIGSTASAAAQLPLLSGEFTTQAGKITGIVHAQAAGSCVSPKTSFELSGTTDAKNAVTLTGPVAGGTLTVTGTLAEDGKSLTSASYSVAGGSCALPSKVQATAQAFQAIDGNYSGTFSDPDGQVVTISAALSQSPSSDGDGNFTLSGTATLPNNPCFPTSVPISSTQVTGGTFTFTYATADNSVTSTGTFSPDASTLTITSWVASGTCGADHGTGAMAKQAS